MMKLLKIGLYAVAVTCSSLSSGQTYSGTSPGTELQRYPIAPLYQLSADNSARTEDTEKQVNGAVIADNKTDKDTDTPSGWFPGTRLFHILEANPRKVSITTGMRYHDDTFNKYRRRLGMDSNVLGKESLFGTISFGSRMPLFRWDSKEHGRIQLNFEGCVWSVLAFKDRSSSLYGDASSMLNTDYYIGVPLTYALKNFSLQYRLYHMSSHIGDELLILYPEINRKNVSYESVDILFSWFAIQEIRLYGGGGYIAHSFQHCKMDPFYIEYGAEFRPFDKRFSRGKIYWQPYLAAHLRNWQNNSWCITGTYVLGMELSRGGKNFDPKLKIYFKFQHGNSVDGQFFNKKTTHISLNISFQII